MADITTTLAALEAAVTNDETVDGSAETLIVQLAKAFADVKNSASAVQALADRITASSGKLSAAVVANTPAAEEPPVVPPTV